MRIASALSLSLMVALAASASGQTPATPPTPAAPAKPTEPAGAARPQTAPPAPIYNESADARADVAAALAKAKADNQHVLVVFGGNWCGWCQKLHKLFRENAGVSKTLLYEYQTVWVDIGKFEKNADLAAGYGADVKNSGVPFLTVLDGDGKPLANQETGALESGDKHDPAKVDAFLAKWKAPARNAEEVFAAAQTRARAEGKLLFLHLGAPWCGWCHRLEDFLRRADIAPCFAADFVDLKIDLDRMTDAEKVASRFRKAASGGIPWFAFVDAGGKTVSTSDAGGENIGYPATPEEIARFMTMLKAAAKRMTPDQQATIERELKKAGKRD